MTYHCTVCKEQVSTSQASESMKFGPVLCASCLQPVKEEVTYRRKMRRRERDFSHLEDYPEIEYMLGNIWDRIDRKGANHARHY